MAVINDVLVCSFTTKGLGGVISGHMAIAKAQDRVAAAQAKLATLGPNDGQKWFNALRSVKDAQDGLFNSYVLGAGKAAVMTGVWIAGIVRLTSEYVRFGNEVMNIKALTGSSSREAVGATLLQQIAGVSDIQEIREILRSGSSVFDSKGQSALGRLGISANPSQKGLSLINEIADRLQTMPDSLRKTQIEEDLFGQRGVAAIQPLLRLTKDQRSAIRDLGGAFDTDALPAIQQFQYATGMLGATFQQKIVFPIAQQILPLLSRLISWFTAIVNFLGWLNQESGGFLAWATGMIAFGAAVGGVVRMVMMLVGAYKALAATETFAAVMAGDVTAIARVAIAGTAAAGIMYGIDKAISASESGQSGATDANTKALVSLSSNVARLNDSFDDAKGKGNGIPNGLQSGDIGALFRNQGLRTIG